jgi:hypothetical protein
MSTEVTEALVDRTLASVHPDSHATTTGESAHGMGRTMLGVAIVWLALDAALGFSGSFSRHLRQLFLFTVTPVVAFVGAFAVSRRLRAWAFALDTRTLVSVQALRAGGLAFLAVAAVGQLNRAFALWGGLLDVATGLSAVFAAPALVPARTARQRGLLAAWMAAGLLDFVVAIPLATRLRARDPAGMAANGIPPLSFITTYAVPLALIDYFILGAQLWRQRGRGPAGEEARR